MAASRLSLPPREHEKNQTQHCKTCEEHIPRVVRCPIGVTSKRATITSPTPSIICHARECDGTFRKDINKIAGHSGSGKEERMSFLFSTTRRRSHPNHHLSHFQFSCHLSLSPLITPLWLRQQIKGQKTLTQWELKGTSQSYQWKTWFTSVQFFLSADSYVFESRDKSDFAIHPIHTTHSQSTLFPLSPSHFSVFIQINDLVITMACVGKSVFVCCCCLWGNHMRNKKAIVQVRVGSPPFDVLIG